MGFHPEFRSDYDTHYWLMGWLMIRDSDDPVVLRLADIPAYVALM